MPARSSQPRNIQGMHGPRRYAPVPRTANHNTVFTAKEVLSFVQSKGLVKAVKTVDTVTDGDIECILKPSGFTRPRIEDRMVEAAFEALAPGLPKIPPDNVMRILEFSKANKLAAAYKINQKVSWSKLRNDLSTKRAEILEAYGTHVVLGGNMAKNTVDHTQAIGHSQPNTLGHMTSGMEPNVVHCHQPKHRASIPPTTSSMGHQNSAGVHKGACGQRLRRTSNEVGLTKTPCYVTTRKKKDFGRQEVEQTIARDVTTTDIETSERGTGLARCLPENNNTVQTGEPKSIPIPEKGKDGHRKGSTSGQPKNGFRRYERVSIHSDVLDALQLVQSPEICEEPEKYRFDDDDDDDWTDNTPPPEQPDLPDENSSTSGSEESPTTRTLRILAEWCNQIDEDKRTGVWQEKQKQMQQRDFMNSPDSDFSFSEACRSPQQIDQCMFAFRGLRIDAPAVPGKPSRHDRPVWYVREDAGSPTPMGLGRHRSNVTFRRKPAS